MYIGNFIGWNFISNKCIILNCVFFLYYYSWWNICILNLFVIVGYVEWKEYYKYFLLVKGYGLNEIEKYLEDYDIDIL